MQVATSEFTVIEYCNQMIDRTIIVNRDYQRASVWPDAAKSYLVETILEGFPIPKLTIYQVLDLKNRKTIKEIVDGQQRSLAILEFYEDKYKLKGKSDYTGKRFSDLDETVQQKFLSYLLAVDVIINATRYEIIEMFRRINSYTVPLNTQEQRHATYQGDFKWFINEISVKLSPPVEKLGVFSTKKMARMDDSQFYSDLVFNIVHGISRVRANNLDALYKEFDQNFPMKQMIEDAVYKSIDYLLQIEKIYGTELTKPTQFISLILAIINCYIDSELRNECGRKNLKNINDVSNNLLYILDLLEKQSAANKSDIEFLNASQKATGDANSRRIRFLRFCQAIAD